MSSDKSTSLIFQKGQAVLLTRFRRRGVVHDGPNRKGEYVVDCSGLIMTVAASELAPSTPSTSEKDAKETFVRRSKAKTALGSSSLRLDLHGMQREAAVSALEQMIDRAVRQEGSKGESVRIELIHGLGKGTLKKAVHDYLRTCRLVKSYRLDVGNPGVTWVYL